MEKTLYTLIQTAQREVQNVIMITEVNATMIMKIIDARTKNADAIVPAETVTSGEMLNKTKQKLGNYQPNNLISTIAVYL